MTKALEMQKREHNAEFDAQKIVDYYKNLGHSLIDAKSLAIIHCQINIKDLKDSVRHNHWVIGRIKYIT